MMSDIKDFMIEEVLPVDIQIESCPEDSVFERQRKLFNIVEELGFDRILQTLKEIYPDFKLTIPPKYRNFLGLKISTNRFREEGEYVFGEKTLTEEETQNLVMRAFNAKKTMAKKIIKWWATYSNFFYNRELLQDKYTYMLLQLTRNITKTGIISYHLKFRYYVYHGIPA